MPLYFLRGSDGVRDFLVEQPNDAAARNDALWCLRAESYRLKRTARAVLYVLSRKPGSRHLIRARIDKLNVPYDAAQEARDAAMLGNGAQS